MGTFLFLAEYNYLEQPGTYAPPYIHDIDSEHYLSHILLFFPYDILFNLLTLYHRIPTFNDPWKEAF